MRNLLALLLLILVQPLHAQTNTVTLSGLVKDAGDHSTLPYVTVLLLSPADSALVAGTVTGDDGRFSLAGLKSGNYLLKMTYAGYQPQVKPVLIGQLSPFLDLGSLDLQSATNSLAEVTITGKQDVVGSKMDKKTVDLSANIAQSGSSVLEAMKNIAGVTVQDGKVQLRGSDKVMVLIDGKQTALTGFGNQSGLDNIPASAIEKIEIINNPSARHDANGNAGIINIIYKKEKKEGLNGKVGLSGGLGALWIKKDNYPGVGQQYQATPKLNPSLSLNYRKNKLNLFLQADNLYSRTLNKNEFTERTYDNGDVVQQQTRRNRITNVVTAKAGADWYANAHNTFNLSGLFSSEKILDRGEEPFFNADLSQRQRLWAFLEDELKTTATVTTSWQHQFRQPGRLLSAGFNYTYHRENEQYFFTNILPSYTGLDSFKLLSDEHVADLNIDYVQPLRYGRIELGAKFRRRFIPVNMHFKPGLNSPLDVNAGGWADYTETIPALYSNYVLETQKLELEAGLRVEYVDVQYKVNPGHNTYKSAGYDYAQPFPNLRLSYKINERNRLSFFGNRRVDRPNEVDIRIFPKYDDAGIVKVGNPALRPQFTNSFELGYKTNRPGAFLYVALYHKRMEALITRIATVVPGSDIIYNIFQNAGNSQNTGMEILLSKQAGKLASFELSFNGYQNTIDAFSVVNLYPEVNTYTASREELFSGNVKFNALFHLPKKLDAQLTATYLAPDIVPQGRLDARFSMDIGLKKSIQNGRGELFINATDIANTLRLRREVHGTGFRYTSTDYYETQVLRMGYNFKF